MRRVQRQAEQWWGAPDHNPRGPAAPADFGGLLAGKRAHTGTLNWAAVDPRDTAQHAHPQDWERPYDRGHTNPYGYHEPTAWEEEQSQLAGEDEDSGYNWGPPPDPDELHESEIGEAPHALQSPHYDDYGPEENAWEHQIAHEGRRRRAQAPGGAPQQPPGVAPQQPADTGSGSVLTTPPAPTGGGTVSGAPAPADPPTPMETGGGAGRVSAKGEEDPYGGSSGAYTKQRSIDDRGGKKYKLVHPDIRKALQRRFDGGSASVWAPGKPGVILHDIENFWDGPSEVRHLGGGELEYTSPYSGETDRFNARGYYNRDGELVPWSREAAKTSAQKDPEDLYNPAGNLDPNPARLDKSVSGNPLKPGSAAPVKAQAPKIQPPPKIPVRQPKTMPTPTTAALEKWADDLFREAQDQAPPAQPQPHPSTEQPNTVGVGPTPQAPTTPLRSSTRRQAQGGPWAGWPGALPGNQAAEAVEETKTKLDNTQKKLKPKHLPTKKPQRAPAKGTPAATGGTPAATSPSIDAVDPLSEEKNEDYQTLASKTGSDGMSQRDVFLNDLARANKAIQEDHAKNNSLITYEDGSKGIDPTATKLPKGFLDTYQNLLSYGYANGYI